MIETGRQHDTEGLPPEFRQRVVALVDEGRKVSEVAAELEVSEQTIYTWYLLAMTAMELTPDLPRPDRLPRRLGHRSLGA